MRSDGSCEALWELYERELAGNLSGGSDQNAIRADNRIRNMLQSAEITRTDIPLLDAQIDRARFYILEEGQFYSSVLSLTASTDIDTLSEAVISGLQYHLAEG